jgi:hypothetical protein
MRKYKHYSRLFIALFATLLVAVISIAPALAAEEKKSEESSIQSVAQSYKTTAALQQGLLVQVDDKDQNLVKVVTYKDAKKLFGIVVGVGDTPVSLSPSASGTQAYVVTSGRYKVLVSTQNGAIAKGDFVGPSSVDGIAAKTTKDDTTVLGRAVAGFDAKSGVLSSVELKASDGSKKKISIGMITVDIDIKPNPLITGNEGGVPLFLLDIASTVAGQPVSATQTIAAIAILVIGLVVVAILLNGGIRTAMQAVGRNPLARKSIMRNMVQVIVTGIIIFIGCLIAVYLILKL